MDANELIKKIVSSIVIGAIGCVGLLFTRVNDLEAKSEMRSFALSQILKKIDKIERKIDFIYRNLKN